MFVLKKKAFVDVLGGAREKSRIFNGNVSGFRIKGVGEKGPMYTV